MVMGIVVEGNQAAPNETYDYPMHYSWRGSQHKPDLNSMDERILCYSIEAFL